MNCIEPQINMNTFYGFIKLEKSQQLLVLREKALKLDTDVDNNHVTNLYFLNGFFVEEIRNCADNKLVDILPYKRGYKLESFLREKIFLN